MKGAAWLGILLGACASSSRTPAYLVYLRDRQGSVLAAVDDRGEQVWRQKQDSFGLRLSSTGTPIPRGFLDRPLDEETGFYQFHYRTYDPASAQWLTPDPLLLEHPGQCMDHPQACNPYAYAGNRATEWTDPDGRWVDVRQVGGETYVSLTAGVVGPDAQRVAEALAGAANRFTAGTHVHVNVMVKVYQSLAEIPKSVTPILIDPSVEVSNVRPDKSMMTLGRDALGANMDELQKIIGHEDGHLFGLDDAYFSRAWPLLAGRSLPGHADDIMGDFWASPHAPAFAPSLQKLLENPALARNTGLAPPTFDESPPGAIISGEYPGGVSLPPTVP
jgi:RHS repeat-associated protein